MSKLDTKECVLYLSRPGYQQKGAESVKGAMKEPRFTTGGGGDNYFREGYEEKCGTCCTRL